MPASVSLFGGGNRTIWIRSCTPDTSGAAPAMSYGWTNAPMKTIGFFIVTGLFMLSHALAGTTEHEFIRKPGQYPLDDKGSTLRITKQPAGSWSLKATWRFEDSSSTAAPDDCLRANGWFIFVETPGRIWIFDGVDQGILLSHSGKETSVSSFSHQVMTDCPRKVLDALPQEVRAKYQKVEGGAANGAPRPR